MAALGEEFRSAREARGLSFTDVADRLHIRTVYLAAIEAEDWSAIGAPVYVRGFIRTYARFLALDPEDAVARFTASIPPDVPVAGTVRPAMAASSASARRGAAGGAGAGNPSVPAVIAIVVAVAVVLFVGYEFYQFRSGSPAIATPVAAGSGVPSPPAASPAAVAAAGETAGLPSPAAAAPSAKPGAERGLSVRATQASWVRIDVDGSVAYEGTLRPGASKSFAGKSAVIRVGNAGGVEIGVNGKSVGSLGASGDVVERRFVLTGE